MVDKRRRLRVNQNQKKAAWLLCGVGVVLLVVVLCWVAPSTRPYERVVQIFFNTQHQTIAYYLNYNDSNLAMQLGAYYFNGGAYDLPKATASYKLALTLTPGVLWGHYQLARIYFVQDQLSQALGEINAELAANPQNLRSLYVRGLIEDAQRNLPDAEADFTKFVAWAPSEWAGYNDLSFVLSEEGNYSQAEKVIHQALLNVPAAATNPWLWNSLGLAQLNELHYAQAQESFMKAQALAKEITPQVWRHAYSGNDPAVIEQSIAAFQKAIAANLQTAQAGEAF